MFSDAPGTEDEPNAQMSSDNHVYYYLSVESSIL